MTAAFGAMFNQFANEEKLKSHYNKHGEKLGISSPQEYERMAEKFRVQGLNNPSTTVLQDKIGVYRIYDRANNLFGAYNSDGTTRTFHRGDGGNYWGTQPRELSTAERRSLVNRMLRGGFRGNDN